MNRFFYFKVTFLSLSAGLFAGRLVYGLCDIDFSNSEAFIKLLLKAFVTVIVTGFLLGILPVKVSNFDYNF